MKKLALLGSTGSIGTQALDVVRCIQKEGEHAVKVEALAAHSNIRLLEAQIREFKPQAVAVLIWKLLLSSAPPSAISM